MPLYLISFKKNVVHFHLADVPIRYAAQENVGILKKIKNRIIAGINIHPPSKQQLEYSVNHLWNKDSFPTYTRLSDSDKSEIIESISRNIEKLSLKTSKQKEKFLKFPHVSKWQNVKFIVDSNYERVCIIAGSKTKKVHYSKLGFRKGKGEKIGKWWATLMFTADEKKARKIQNAMKRGTLKSNISKIRGVLKNCFEITEDPFYKWSDHGYYIPKFQITIREI